jgi:ribose-phosphate pyrophosphokinase
MGDRAVDVALHDAERIRGHVPVLIDDIISTGQTMIAAAQRLREAGGPSAYCVAVHGIFADGVQSEMLNAGIRRVITCNTISHETNEIDLDPGIAHHLRELLSGREGYEV